MLRTCAYCACVLHVAQVGSPSFGVEGIGDGTKLHVHVGRWLVGYDCVGDFGGVSALSYSSPRVPNGWGVASAPGPVDVGRFFAMKHPDTPLVQPSQG